MLPDGPRLGATHLGDNRCGFNVWAPAAERVDVRVVEPVTLTARLQHNGRGYHGAVVEGIEQGSLYYYVLDGQKQRPDPASRSQPRGVHGPSQVVDLSPGWHDPGWTGLPLRDYVIYELHVGTFTPEGTFDAVVPHLDELKELGVTALELMPVAQFPGHRNWGYDGVYPFAAQDSYGGVEGLRRLVSACHQRGLAIVLDVVYNHVGPEGNYLADFGPYFTAWYRTPWGAAINFDGPDSDEVKRYFIESALHWVTDFGIDALRLDAVHAILDHSASPFIERLGVAVKRRAEELGRRIHLIAESEANDVRLIRSREGGGYGMDAQWSDDFHHCLHTLLTGEGHGYYQDYGTLDQLAKAFREGFAYTGEYSHYRRRSHGSPSRSVPAERFVVCAQNHDQVGNRMLGERLGHLVSFEQVKLAAGMVALSPFLPLLFMGEEYGETAPFLYFVSHSDPDLVEAVRKGRREEFAAFQWLEEPPDPQQDATFLRCKLNHPLRDEGHHRVLREFYQELLRLRRDSPALAFPSKENLEAETLGDMLILRRWAEGAHVAVLANFGGSATSAAVPLPSGVWRKVLDSADPRWGGPGAQAPEILDSSGRVSPEVPGQSFLVLSLF